MITSGVAVGLRRLSIAITTIVAVMGAAHAANAQIASVASSFDKKDMRVKSDRKVAGSSRAKHASRRVGGKKYAGRHGRRNSVAQGKVGNRGSLMATLASVKPSGLPLQLAAAVVTIESGWRVNARGSSGEQGLMQIMPATGRRFGGGNLFDPTTNMRVGTRYLHWCYQRAGGNVAATIGCYNRGPGLMWSWKGSRITRGYVNRVHGYMRG